MSFQTVRDVMRDDPVTVTTCTPFKDLVGIIVRDGVRAVPVLGRHGEVVGTVTETDLLRKQGIRSGPAAVPPARRTYRARWARAAGDCAGELMTTRPVTVQPGVTLAEAARLMERHHCAWLPVVDEVGQLAGTVSARELLRVFLRADSDIRGDITRAIRDGGFAAGPGGVTVDVADGVATLAGTVERKSMLPRVLAMIAAVDGLVDVEGQLGYVTDDTREPAVARPVSRVPGPASRR